MIWQQASSSTNDYYVDAVALNLHSFYAGVEHVLEVVADMGLTKLSHQVQTVIENSCNR
jgi:hypothetical protein